MNTAAKASIFSLKENRRVKIFLFFLVLTSIIWLLIELSKSYNSIAVFKVQYENVPDDKLLQNTLVSEVGIVLKHLVSHNLDTRLRSIF